VSHLRPAPAAQAATSVTMPSTVSAAATAKQQRVMKPRPAEP
jgi:hypothetical protein